MIRVSTNYHYVKLTCTVFMLAFIRHVNKTNSTNFWLKIIMVTGPVYLIFQSVS